MEKKHNRCPQAVDRSQVLEGLYNRRTALSASLYGCQNADRPSETHVDRIADEGGMSTFKGAGLIGRLLSNLSYIDYAFMAFRIGRQVFRLFRRR